MKANKKIRGTWTTSGYFAGESPNFKGKIDHDLDMIRGYSLGLFKDISCFFGWHRWSGWNSHILCNTEEIRANPSECLERDGVAVGIRVCCNCGAEMPRCRKGEKNYKEFKQNEKNPS